uniref:RING-type domain-containing protein n=1 Tax=Chromera velia CCMP2878 TaxID=1169474 RepID=A0A0K6SB23_9ALVE|eukprot:Cvel_12939.t2-p1 / transcript=Cvel_12939.t2 / gene=Cvel_12939 / organism=Chromera_velia_CCMP2878 / gene_product=hypothetical protein / transcript_product=hypothetical protein / location=Cvel_scaffold865:55976-63561(+) / protein_length=1837 / sequence_SO=supercontig / SO=protein_coding / is_pseudo=false
MSDFGDWGDFLFEEKEEYPPPSPPSERDPEQLLLQFLSSSPSPTASALNAFAAENGIDTSPHEESIFFVAASLGNVSVVDSLLNLFPVTLRDEQGRTVLHRAIKSRRDSLVRFLCYCKKIGWDRKRALFEVRDERGLTPLAQAVVLNFVPAIIALCGEQYCGGRNPDEFIGQDVEVVREAAQRALSETTKERLIDWLHFHFLQQLSYAIFTRDMTPEKAQERLRYLGVDPEMFGLFDSGVDQVLGCVRVACLCSDARMLRWLLDTYGEMTNLRELAEREAYIPIGGRALMGRDGRELSEGGYGEDQKMNRVKMISMFWDGQGSFADFLERRMKDRYGGEDPRERDIQRSVDKEIKRQRGTGWGLREKERNKSEQEQEQEGQQEEEVGEGDMGTLFPSRVSTFEMLVDHIGLSVVPPLDPLVDLGRVDILEYLIKKYEIDLLIPLPDNLEEVLEAEREEELQATENGGEEGDTCGICCDKMVNPITLDCPGKHTFCRVCLRRVRYPNAERPNIPCPLCRHEVYFPHAHDSVSDRQARALREWITRDKNSPRHSSEDESDRDSNDREIEDRSRSHQWNKKRPPLWWARRWWEGRGRLWDKADTLGSSLLAVAFASSAMGVVEKLRKDFGMDPGKATFLGRSMLHVAVTCGQRVSVKWLLSRYGAELASLVCREDGRAPVHVAALQGDDHLIGVLEDFVGGEGVKDSEGRVWEDMILEMVGEEDEQTDGEDGKGRKEKKKKKKKKGKKKESSAAERLREMKVLAMKRRAPDTVNRRLVALLEAEAPLETLVALCKSTNALYTLLNNFIHDRSMYWIFAGADARKRREEKSSEGNQEDGGERENEEGKENCPEGGKEKEDEKGEGEGEPSCTAVDNTDPVMRFLMSHVLPKYQRVDFFRWVILNVYVKEYRFMKCCDWGGPPGFTPESFRVLAHLPPDSQMSLPLHPLSLEGHREVGRVCEDLQKVVEADKALSKIREPLKNLLRQSRDADGREGLFGPEVLIRLRNEEERLLASLPGECLELEEIQNSIFWTKEILRNPDNRILGCAYSARGSGSKPTLVEMAALFGTVEALQWVLDEWAKIFGEASQVREAIWALRTVCYGARLSIGRPDAAQFLLDWLHSRGVDVNTLEVPSRFRRRPREEEVCLEEDGEGVGVESEEEEGEEETGSEDEEGVQGGKGASPPGPQSIEKRWKDGPCHHLVDLAVDILSNQRSDWKFRCKISESPEAKFSDLMVAVFRSEDVASVLLSHPAVKIRPEEFLSHQTLDRSMMRSFSSNGLLAGIAETLWVCKVSQAQKEREKQAELDRERREEEANRENGELPENSSSKEKEAASLASASKQPSAKAIAAAAKSVRSSVPLPGVLSELVDVVHQTSFFPHPVSLVEWLYADRLAFVARKFCDKIQWRDAEQPHLEESSAPPTEATAPSPLPAVPPAASAAAAAAPSDPEEEVATSCAPQIPLSLLRALVKFNLPGPLEVLVSAFEVSVQRDVTERAILEAEDDVFSFTRDIQSLMKPVVRAIREAQRLRWLLMDRLLELAAAFPSDADTSPPPQCSPSAPSPQSRWVEDAKTRGLSVTVHSLLNSICCSLEAANCLWVSGAMERAQLESDFVAQFPEESMPTELAAALRGDRETRYRTLQQQQQQVTGGLPHSTEEAVDEEEQALPPPSPSQHAGEAEAEKKEHLQALELLQAAPAGSSGLLGGGGEESKEKAVKVRQKEIGEAAVREADSEAMVPSSVPSRGDSSGESRPQPSAAPSSACCAQTSAAPPAAVAKPASSVGPPVFPSSEKRACLIGRMRLRSGRPLLSALETDFPHSPVTLLVREEGADQRDSELRRCSDK